MAEAVVHQLEAVEVQQQQCQRAGLTGLAGDRMLEAVQQQCPVGQVGERVVQRLPVECSLRFPAIGDIVRSHHRTEPGSLVVGEGKPVHEQGSRVGVLGREDYLGVSYPLAAQCPEEGNLLHRQRSDPVRPVEGIAFGPFLCPGCRRQPVKISADSVDQGQTPLGIAGDDTGVQVLQNCLEEVRLIGQLLRGRPPVADILHVGHEVLAAAVSVSGDQQVDLRPYLVTVCMPVALLDLR